MLCGREFLIAEKHHFVFVPQIDNLMERDVIQVLRQINTQNFSTEHCARGSNVYHWQLSNWRNEVFATLTEGALRANPAIVPRRSNLLH